MNHSTRWSEVSKKMIYLQCTEEDLFSNFMKAEYSSLMKSVIKDREASVLPKVSPVYLVDFDNASASELEKRRLMLVWTIYVC